MMIMNQLILSMALASIMVDTVVDATVLHHASLRHRELARTCKTADEDCVSGDRCCGKRECQEGRCCIPDGVLGCDESADCCEYVPSEGEICGVVKDSMCGTTITDDSGGRKCKIHGEDCTVDGASNSCCGKNKYSCAKVNNAESETCCMEVETKGCTDDLHCCGYDNTKPSSPHCIESTCITPGVTPPPNTSCSNKGGDCEEDGDCCGSTRLLCGDDGTCCVDTDLKGCEDDVDCCSGKCDLDISTCVDAS